MSVRQTHLHSLLVHNFGLFFHDFPSHLNNRFVYIVFLFCTNSEPFNMIFLQKLNMLRLDGSLFAQITFINKTINPILWRILLCFLHPVADNIIKCFRIMHIINQNYRMCTLIVRFCYPSESLLSCCIPYLQL